MMHRSLSLLFLLILTLSAQVQQSPGLSVNSQLTSIVWYGLDTAPKFPGGRHWSLLENHNRWVKMHCKNRLRKVHVGFLCLGLK
jgi:hypothetical protein